MTICPFNGDITKWTSFWDSYESAIHTDTDLSEVDKLNYLQSLMERTARDAISGLTLTAANYKEAVEILQKRFGSRQQIISKHMDILLNLDPVVSVSAKALHHLELTGRLMAVCFLLCCSASCHQTYISWRVGKGLECEVVAREQVGGSQA